MRPPISQEQEALLGELRAELRQHHRRGRLLVAVDGRDGAGKTLFADALADVLREDGSTVFRASADDFHRPRAERHARGRTSAEGHYRDSYDTDALLARLLRPFRAGAPFVTATHDLDEDRAVDLAAESAPADAILVVDGLFLLRPELRDVWNWSVWLDVPLDVAFRRMAERDGSDPDPLGASNARYREGFDLYLQDGDPRGRASVILDNTDPRHPVRVFRDFC
ncbi:uridine kinase [Microbacterium sp. SORGH_AS_0862]|uniref:uridine kinase n=1 Tax=Microbacterium sp. SORGH_AS_0862 TaxID=3041789 RepID=UPI002791AD71|nr:uridine kinase [Microbacterium sp. SORGH_AS_0862]MDQ1204081.1 uridine kinase [Microbacterium sp. SORGH_AS_0862]